MEISRCTAGPLACRESPISRSSASDREDSAETTYRGNPQTQAAFARQPAPDDITWGMKRKRSCVSKFERGASDELIRMSLQPARANDQSMKHAAATLTSLHYGIGAADIPAPAQRTYAAKRWVQFDPRRSSFDRDLRLAGATSEPAPVRSQAVIRLLHGVANQKLGLLEYHAVITATAKMLGDCRLQSVEAAKVDQALLTSAMQTAPSDGRYIQSVRSHALGTLRAMPPLRNEAAASAWLLLAAKTLEGAGGHTSAPGVLHQCELRIDEANLAPATRAGICILAARAANLHAVNPLENSQWRRRVLAELTAAGTSVRQNAELLTGLAQGRYGLRHTRMFDADSRPSFSEVEQVTACIEAAHVSTMLRTDLLLQCIDVLPRVCLPVYDKLAISSLRRRLMQQIGNLITPEHLQPPALSLVVKKICDVDVMRSLDLRAADYHQLSTIAAQAAQALPASDMATIAHMLRLMPYMTERSVSRRVLERDAARAVQSLREGPQTAFASRLAILLISFNAERGVALSERDKELCLSILRRSLFA